MLLPLIVKGQSRTCPHVETLGARLKRFRELAGKTQAAVQKALGLGKVALSEYENGKTAPSEEVLQGLAREYGASAAVLRYGEAALQSAANDYWAGYADAILGVMEDAANRQRQLVRGLRGEAVQVAEAPGGVVTQPAPKPWLSNEQIDADVAAAQQFEERVGVAVPERPKRKKKTG